MISATIQSVTKIGDNQIGVQFTLSTGELKELQFSVDADKADIRQAIKSEVARLNSIDAKINAIASDLIGKVIN